MPVSQDWTEHAIRKIEADYNRSADTHLIPVDLPAFENIQLYLKDESSHPTGSLKHRLARSLFLYALCSGWLREGMPVIEASSGSTAVSEAYFARMLNLPFVAVVPRAIASEKAEAIQFYGGRCHYVERAEDAYEESLRLADDIGGHFMDQFTYAERVTDWRGNNNIAESIFAQMSDEPCPIPQWIVCSAGTGGTSATIGRFARYHRHDTRLCLADPEASVFHRHWSDRKIRTVRGTLSLIEGIGRASVEPSFIAQVIDLTIAVPDVASIAAARTLSRRLGRLVGGSTGTNLWACAVLASEMAARAESGSIVSILCDHGERYGTTYYNDDWLTAHAIDIAPWEARMEAFFERGVLT